MSDLRDDASALFVALTGSTPLGVWSAPGALTVLGDAAGAGATLGIAIDRRTVVAAGPREDAVLRVVSAVAEAGVEVALDDLDAVRGHAPWADPALGVAWALGHAGVDLRAVPGVDLVVDSTVPIGAAQGSSSALGAAVARALDDLWRSGMSPHRLAAIVAGADRDDGSVALGAAGAHPALLARDDAAVHVDAAGDAAGVELGFERAGLVFVLLDTGDAGAPTPAADAADLVDRAVGALRAGRPADLGALLDAASERQGPTTPELALALETARTNGALGARAMRSGVAIALAPVDAVSRLQVGLDGAFAEHGYAAPEVTAVRASNGAVRDR